MREFFSIRVEQTYGKGNALNGLKRYDEAIRCFDKAIELDPNYAYPQGIYSDYAHSI
jgi:tetratricopeptide (TPR) repeat protein